VKARAALLTKAGGANLKRWWGVYAILLLLAAAATVAAAHWPYFPGDLAAARAVQALTGGNLEWARAVTNTARIPWNFLLAAGTAAVAWRLGGWRAALLALASFAVPSLAGLPLQNVVARPRPAPTLVQVVGSSSGYSFPSIFALTYGATVGFLALLARRHPSPQVTLLVPALCVVLLVVGGAARVALGAHWPSDVLVSYLLALLWAALLLKISGGALRRS
jgi:membrane-associated phospholipid phosphatase